MLFCAPIRLIGHGTVCLVYAVFCIAFMLIVSMPSININSFKANVVERYRCPNRKSKDMFVHSYRSVPQGPTTRFAIVTS